MIAQVFKKMKRDKKIKGEKITNFNKNLPMLQQNLRKLLWLI